jgi:hypothetical protein
MGVGVSSGDEGAGQVSFWLSESSVANYIVGELRPFARVPALWPSVPVHDRMLG